MKIRELPSFLICILWGAMNNLDATAQLQPLVADSFLNFMQSNKNRASIFISANDTTIAQLNEDKLMPLASTMKIMVAVEFAMQASAKMLDKDSYVSLRELEKYYLPDTDGGAHPAWLDYEHAENNIKKDSVQLIEVARGMTMFNSNANTEFLMDLLGFDNVKNNHQLFELRNHTAIFPVVSSLFIYQNPGKLRENKLLSAISNLSEEEYCKYAFAIHNKLKNNVDYKSGFRPQDLSPKMQKLWSDRSTASTTKEYVHLVKILNNRKFLDENTYGIIAEVLEFPMESKTFQDEFRWYGGQGGSTSFVLTHVIYFTNKNGEKMELAIFFNDLTAREEKQLERWLYPFEGQVIFDSQFREKLKF
ncbi:MAG: serine hydrolase [Ferruginibacter sp.]